MDSPPSGDSGETDESFRLLAHRYRRHVVRILAERSGELDLETVAAEIARRGRTDEDSAVSSESVSDVYVSLYHTHVPKLAAGNAVYFERSEEVVASRERVESLVAILDEVQ